MSGQGLNLFGSGGSKAAKQSSISAHLLGKAADPASGAAIKAVRCDGSHSFQLPRRGARWNSLTDLTPMRDRKIERDADALEKAVESAKAKPTELSRGTNERRHLLKFMIDTEAAMERFGTELANKQAQVKKWEQAMTNGTKEGFWKDGSNRRVVRECLEVLQKRRTEYLEVRTKLANSIMEEVAAQEDVIEYKAIHAVM